MDTNGTTEHNQTLLAREFTKRINQLGMSRRLLVKRTGLSRQTLHNIERGGRTDLKPQTLMALDAGLYWRPGTCLALAHGDESVLVDADGSGAANREDAFKWRIVERIQRMSLEELERMASQMEADDFGTEQPMTTTDLIRTIEDNVMRRLTTNESAMNATGQRT